MKLYAVKIKKGVVFWVVAADAGEAYEAVRVLLRQKDWYFGPERQMDSVTLIADSAEYPDGTDRLIIT